MDVVSAYDQINKRLANYRAGEKPVELYQPIEYSLTMETDRFYPILTLWSCYLYSGEFQKVINPALGVEIFFNFLMVHSDLLDNNLERHGQESVQVKWNQNVAILSGDAMIFKAYELLIQVQPELIKPVVRNFNRCFTRICEGKQLVLNAPESQQDLDILRMNPGALGEFSMLLGALIGGADQEQQALAGKLGTEIALNHAHSTIKLLVPLNCPKTRKKEFEHWLTRQY